MADLDRLLADLERVAEACNRFAHPDLQRAAFNLLVTALDTPPRPDQLPYSRAQHYAATAATAVIPAYREHR